MLTFCSVAWPSLFAIIIWSAAIFAFPQPSLLLIITVIKLHLDLTQDAQANQID
jgi:hypothetical protein